MPPTLGKELQYELIKNIQALCIHSLAASLISATYNATAKAKVMSQHFTQTTTYVQYVKLFQIKNGHILEHEAMNHLMVHVINPLLDES